MHGYMVIAFEFRPCQDNEFYLYFTLFFRIHLQTYIYKTHVQRIPKLVLRVFVKQHFFNSIYREILMEPSFKSANQ